MNKFSKFPAEVICEFHPLFKGLLWVSSARSTDETRYALMGIHVEREGLDCHLVATDGRRLHLHTFDPGMFDDDIQMIEPGLYEVITKTPKLIVIAPSEVDDSSYPKWRAVVPDYVPTHSDVVNSRTTGKMGIKTGVLLAVDFLSDAIGFNHGRKKDDSVLVTYGSQEKGQPFVISHDLGKAIVMPLRNEGDEDEKEQKTDEESTPDLPALEALLKALANDGGGSMTISVAGKDAVTITSDQAKKALKKTDKSKGKKPAEQHGDYDPDSVEFLFLEELAAACLPKDKAKRKKMMQSFIEQHDENAFLRVWMTGKRTGFHAGIMEEIAVFCREIDPTGDFEVH